MNLNKMLSTIDMHVAGEPLRIITGGLPEIKGETQPERRAYCMAHLDHIRKFLMHEPRGHAGMYGCIITPPASSHADFGVLFMHNEGWSTMCGHGIIAVVTMGIETGKFEVMNNKRRFIIDSPAGEIIASADYDGEKVQSVTFENVPAFTYLSGIELKVDDLEIEIDVCFGGAFYGILNSSLLNFTHGTQNVSDFKYWGKRIKEELEKNFDITHPLQHDLKGVYGVIFSEPSLDEGVDWKNITVFADRQIDRSPCGTGTSAKAAELYYKELLNVGDSFVNQGIVGESFTCKLEAVSEVDNAEAVITSVTGKGHMTGISNFVLDKTDELGEGFFII